MDEVAHGDVSRETLEKLQLYEALVRKWTDRINLVAAPSKPHIWQRHIVDSLQLQNLCSADISSYVDMGSGGGFPGIVLATVLTERDSETKVSLIESDLRKATFLRTALRELGISGKVQNSRIEALDGLNADLITARALAPLPKLLGYVSHHLSPSGTALLPKGRNYEKEIASAREIWQFDVDIHPSQTDPDARILEIRNISRDDRTP